MPPTHGSWTYLVTCPQCQRLRAAYLDTVRNRLTLATGIYQALLWGAPVWRVPSEAVPEHIAQGMCDCHEEDEDDAE